jgi:hypothetical protein
MIRSPKPFRTPILLLSMAFLPSTFAGGHVLGPHPPDPNVSVGGFFSADKAQRGRTIQAAVVMEIPGGYHVNSNRPMSKYAIPTVLRIDGPSGMKIGPVAYPRATVRRLKASNNEPLAVFEGRAVMRFNVTVPANFQEGMTELRIRLRYQSCNDEVCFAPQTREVSMPIGVVGSGDSVKRINGQIFRR